jgi:photosystem II stability/assembly factor-like uncharacterized protein
MRSSVGSQQSFLFQIALCGIFWTSTVFPAEPDGFSGGVVWDRVPIAPEVKSCELIWVHPRSGEVFAFCNKGDVYHSTDDGQTWSLLTEQAAARPTGMIEQVVLDPKDDRRMYASSMYGGGAPFVTLDGGKNWKPLGPGHIDYLAVDFTDPARKTVLASKHETHNGFIVTRDATALKPAWDKLDLKANTAFGSFIYVLNSKTWLVGTGGDWGGGYSGVYRTDDAGQLFRVLTDLPGPKPRSGFQEHDGKLFYLSGKGIVTSTDRGGTWNVRATPQQPWTLDFGPDNKAWLVTETGLFSSRDGLNTWQPASSSLRIASAHFCVSPKSGTMFASTYGDQGLRHRGRWQDKPADLIVWSGDQPAGLTWAKLGPKGEMKEVPEAGFQGKGSALVIRMGGDGWRGCGLNWKGWYPETACDDASPYTALVFYIRQVTKVKDADLTISLVDNIKRPQSDKASNSVNVVADGGLEQIDGEWRRVVMPLNLFTRNMPLQLKGLWEIDFSNTGSAALTFQVDRIGFAVEHVEPPRFKSGAAYHVKAHIAANGPMQAVSDAIYGVCSLPREKLSEYHIPITRWGGNPSTRYNWELGVDNAGSDWYFTNRGKPLARLSESGYVAHIDGNQVFGATTYQTVPMIGWVAKDNTSYGFSVAKYGPQKCHEPGKPDVGNGVRPDGSNITGNDPQDTSVPASPEFIGRAVRYVVHFAGKADGSDGRPGVKYWALDNEPMLWHATHRDVHPQPLSYDELWQRTVAYAEAIHAADPTAKVAGFCSWGWTDLYYSAKDAGSDSYHTKSDWLNHEKMPLAEWFIKQCGDYKRQHGKSLVDVLDVHWYPQGQVKGRGAYQGQGLEPELNAYRLRSTRDLWDRTYEQESWIRNTDYYSPVALIPRVRAWIDKHNPGMEICLGEYNFGGGDNVTGGLAQCDVFGILARERVDLAFIWYSPIGSQNLGWQLFRSYDGNGHGFGEKLLSAQSDNLDLALYAARRSDNAITVAAINKNLHGSCHLQSDLGGLKGNMRVWKFDQDTGENVQEVAEWARPVNGSLELILPAASASMIVIEPAATTFTQ